VVCYIKKYGEVKPMFNVGDMAVYPAHGVGVIEAIETKNISGNEHVFYIMRLLENDMKIMIPRKNAAQVGLRNLISKDDIERVYAILNEKNIEFTTQTWNRRYREYMDKIKTGSIFELAVVLRDLYLIQGIKSLSFGEKKMFETSRNLLIKELALAQQLTEKDIMAQLQSIFAGAELLTDQAAKPLGKAILHAV
jgi:CarD family transcriptional regulator